MHMCRTARSYIRCQLTRLDLQVSELSLNEFNDPHVSFSAMHLALSPDNKRLLVSTDSSQMVLFCLRPWMRLGCIHGVDSDFFHIPCTCWHPDAHHVYAATPCGQLKLYDTASGGVEGKIDGHTGRVRQMVVRLVQGQLQLLTCSFDKSVLLFESTESI
jgi:hypothetical protein